MKYQFYAVVDGKPKVIFSTDSKAEYMEFADSLPGDEEPPEYQTDEPGYASAYGPATPWNAPGVGISDFL